MTNLATNRQAATTNLKPEITTSSPSVNPSEALRNTELRHSAPRLEPKWLRTESAVIHPGIRQLIQLYSDTLACRTSGSTTEPHTLKSAHLSEPYHLFATQF